LASLAGFIRKIPTLTHKLTNNAKSEDHIMLKKTLTAFILSFVSLLGNGWEKYAALPRQKTSEAATGTLQKMIVESGSVTMDLDLKGLNGSSALVVCPVTLHLAAAAN